MEPLPKKAKKEQLKNVETSTEKQKYFGPAEATGDPSTWWLKAKIREGATNLSIRLDYYPIGNPNEKKSELFPNVQDRQKEGWVGLRVTGLASMADTGYNFFAYENDESDSFGICTRSKRKGKRKADAPAPAPPPPPPPPGEAAPAPAAAITTAHVPATEEPPAGDKNFRPEIERLEGDTVEDACAKLKELLEHKDLHKQKRGDIGEIIFAMLAPAEFEVNWNDVAIVGAHANNGVGDGGKDVIIRKVQRRDSKAVVIVDFKAWRDEKRKVCAKDARSIAGALALNIPGEEKGDIREGIVATNRTFTDPATKYKNKYNETNSKSTVKLWDRAYLDNMIRKAIFASNNQGWNGNVGLFIKDVLCYLHHENHIRYKPFADNPDSEESALKVLSDTVGELNFLFNKRWATLGT